ncbi:hypothetical protein RB595_005619 [Gaeumannomyces hyphopodioides]
MDRQGDAAADLADRAASRSGRGKGRGGGGGRRGGGGGGGGGGGAREVTVSRALSKLLRHQAENAGIKLDAEGYAPLDEVLAYGPIRSLQLTVPEVRDMVASSDKQRFSLKPKVAAAGRGEGVATTASSSAPAPTATTTATETTTTAAEAGTASESTNPADWLIRANQGHSIKLESAGLLRPITLDADGGGSTTGPAPVPATVVHGTYFAFWRAIEDAGGLRPMGRNHVHCGTGVPGDDGPAVVSGMRRDAELLVHVDVEASLRDGALAWWLSDNGVVLTEGDADGLVPVRYFREVVGSNPALVGVLWRDGQKVADLPPGLKFRVPAGKERVRGGGSRRGGRGRGRGGGARGGGGGGGGGGGSGAHGE